LPVLIIAVGAAILVIVGPHGAGNAADRGTDHCAFEHADARNQRTGTGTKRGTAQRTGGNPAKRRVIAGRLARIILAILIIAVGIAVIIVVGPHGAGESADAGADCCAFDHVDTGDHRAERGATGGTDCGALGDVARHAAIHSVARTGAERHGSGQQGRHHHLFHEHSPTRWF
jgi:hypothetical protein